MSEDSEAEDKTEDPTQRRLEQSIEKGDVPKSQEAATFLVLGASTLALLIYSALGLGEAPAQLSAFLGQAHQVPMDATGLQAVFKRVLWIMAILLALPLILAMLAGIASGMVMHKPLFTTEPLMPQLSRISPMAGFKRIFGREAFVQFVKSVIKLTVVSVVVIATLAPEWDKLGRLIEASPLLQIEWSLKLVMRLMGGVLALYFLIAGLDIFYQRYQWIERLRMTREDMKKEFKETEGNPEVKAHQRKLRMEAAGKRMMAKIPEASVIITNPTHYAVALRYEAGMRAPILLAKGLDSLALRIREIAKEHDIPILENPPLARALHKSVDIDDEIPEAHYKAVAEVIGYVLRLRNQRQQRRP